MVRDLRGIVGCDVVGVVSEYLEFLASKTPFAQSIGFEPAPITAPLSSSCGCESQQESGTTHLPSTLERAPSTSQPSVQNCAQIHEDCQGNYCEYPRQCGQRLLRSSDTYQASLQPQVDVLGLGCLLSPLDDQAPIQGYSHLHLHSAHPSKRRSIHRGTNVERVLVSLPHSYGPKQSAANIRNVRQSSSAAFRFPSFYGLHPLEVLSSVAYPCYYSDAQSGVQYITSRGTDQAVKHLTNEELHAPSLFDVMAAD